MKLNRKLILVAALVLSVAMATSGTLAYLTDRDSAANVFTMGNVSIKLNEDFQQGVKVLPGQIVDKAPYIENTGSEEAYVWMEIAVPEEMTGSLVFNLSNNSDDENWHNPYYGDWQYLFGGYGNLPSKNVEINKKNYIVSGYYTKDGKLAAGEKTNPLFTKVKLHEMIDITPEGDMYWVNYGTTKDLKWNINTDGSPIMYVSAYAVQAAGFADVEEAYAAYNTQWGNNGTEWGEASFEADTSWYDASESNYEISNASQLFGLAKLVNEAAAKNVNILKGKTIKLAADIDLCNVDWTPIGVHGDACAIYGFTFDGQGHTISNLNVNNTSIEGTPSAGLFGFIHPGDDATSTIKNLTVKNAKVSGKHNVAVIAGYMTGTIENCHVENAKIVNTHDGDGKETCGDKAGVIAGYLNHASSTVKDCSAKDCTVTAGRDAGQLVGAATGGQVVTGTVTNVTVSADDSCTGANIENDLVGRK